MRFSRRTLALAATTAPLVRTNFVHGQSATPSALNFEAASVRVSNLLQYVPGGLLDGDLYVIWNDYTRQIETLRALQPESAEQFSDDQLVMSSLWSNGPELLTWAMQLEEFTGYNIASVLQSLQVGQPPNISLVVELGLQADSLIPFWESAGYEKRENEVGEFWTIGEEAEVDFQQPIQRTMISRLNNIGIIGDNMLAYSPYASMLTQIMSTAIGESPNRVAELEPAFSGVPEDTFNTWLLDGSILEFGNLAAQQATTPEYIAHIEDMIADSDSAAGSMPVLRTLTVGITAGAARDEELHNPNSREFIVVETDAANMAEQAAAVIAWRYENFDSLQTATPHTELLPNLEIDVLNGEFVRISLPLEVPRTMLTRMVQTRDILLFAY